MKRDSRAGTILFLVAVTTVCSLILTFVAEMTRDRREKMENFKLAGLLCAAAGIRRPFDDPAGASAFLDGCDQKKSGPYRIITPAMGSPASRRTAIVFSFPGLWDTITAVIAVSPGLTDEGFMAERFSGLRIVSHKETPGLGGRIEEEWFYRQFEGLPSAMGVKVTMTGTGVTPARADDPVPLSPSEVDGITGATMTCRFLETGVNKMLQDLAAAFPPGSGGAEAGRVVHQPDGFKKREER